jgi:hypothetical protein
MIERVTDKDRTPYRKFLAREGLKSRNIKKQRGTVEAKQK